MLPTYSQDILELEIAMQRMRPMLSISGSRRTLMALLCIALDIQLETV